jgi:metal-dependent amidase/aminoacylase/carboxypeptidase family protein
MHVVLFRTALDAFTILVFRSMARTAWHELETAMTGLAARARLGLMLTNADIAELTDLRRALHRMPELSGQEQATAARVAALVAGADTVLTGLGGHGVAAVWQGATPGPTVMIRAELDALPIEELSGAPWASAIAGQGAPLRP